MNLTLQDVVSRPVYAYYSVDASAMVKLKDMLPSDLFRLAWDEIERLVREGRWRIYDYVAKEIHGEEIERWFDRNPDAIMHFDSNFNRYLNRFTTELDMQGVRMINPRTNKDAGDPFVVTLALVMEQRDLTDLTQRTNDKTCCVLTNEAPKPGKVNIPHVCELYSLPCLNLFDFMRHHGWEITLRVRHPD